MRAFTAFSFFASLASAAYQIQDDYTLDKFADMFTFFTDNDPTDGYVTYVDYATAKNTGLFSTDGGKIRMGVDSKNVITSGRGRNSIRITSKAAYKEGLFILDLGHMPAGACGTWPAFWLLGASGSWPTTGEIDIIEGVNSQGPNSFAVHTTPGCSIVNNNNFAGTLKSSNCDINAPGQATNAGCQILSNDDRSYGGFNAAGGGVYATEWTKEAISIWHFPSSTIPADIKNGKPNPKSVEWGKPTAQFTGCDLNKYIAAQQMIFDITFCGQWAGSVWSSDSVCGKKAPTCTEFVAKNPDAFKDTYWSINSLKVYKDNGVATSSILSTSSSTSKPVPSTFTTIVGKPASTTTTAPVTSTTPVVPTTPAGTTTTAIITTPSTTSATSTTSSSSLTTAAVPPATPPQIAPEPTTFQTRPRPAPTRPPGRDGPGRDGPGRDGPGREGPDKGTHHQWGGWSR